MEFWAPSNFGGPNVTPPSDKHSALILSMTTQIKYHLSRATNYQNLLYLDVLAFC
jgi:hypothetical protein